MQEQDSSLYDYTAQPAVRAQPEQAGVQFPFPEQEQLPCPRCHSTNTKFCYYNNYNLTQPRHFCRACRRHWTKGGTLRNIPVGGGGSGGQRKNSKRSSTSPAAVATKQRPPQSSSSSSSTSSLSKNSTVCNFEGQTAMEGQFGGFVESNSGNLRVSGQFGDPGPGPGPSSSNQWW